VRRIVLPIALALLLSALYASSALAQRHGVAGKGAWRRALRPSIIRVNFDFASLKRGRVAGEIALLRMLPNTTYNATAFESPAPTEPFTPIVAGTLTTDNVGSGNLAINVECIPGSTTFFFAAVPQGPGQTLASSAVELD
jgi:hypothetical protein